MQQVQQKKPKRSAQYFREWRAKKKAEKSLSLNGKRGGARSATRALLAKSVAAQLRAVPTMSMGEALRTVGASENLAKHPAVLTKSAEWNDLLDEYLPKGEVIEAHRALLRASRIESLQFPLDDVNEDDIRQMIAVSGCMVRKIVTGKYHYTVYFYAPDNRARKDALDMVYKLRGAYAADKAAVAFSLAALAASRDAPPTEQIAPAAHGPALPPTA